MSTRYQQFIGVSITVDTTATSLVALIKPTLTGANDEATAPTIARELRLQVTGAGNVSMGDQYVSTSRCAYIISAAGGVDDNLAFADQVPLSEIWLLSDTAGTRVNVLILQ